MRWSSLAAVVALTGGCFAGPPTALPTPVTVGSDNGGQTSSADWSPITAGIERRTLRPLGFGLTSFVALRIDPALNTFRVHYQPEAPLRIDEWRAAFPEALAFVNANFFDVNGRALGLLIADGVVYGQPYVGMGGMLQVEDGAVRVRSTIMEPYFGEALEQAAQAFPMLVTNGAASFANTRGDRASRRTVVAQDLQGRILFISSSSLIGMSLIDLSEWLPTLDLEIVNAVNLDGGGSSMLYAGDVSLPSFDAVPAVIAVYPR